ncbi:MAG: nickel pincer cofactor biosynthesis protein LarC [Blautia sp.]|nr:nickel pincer cofactor biosynthesis protein LarC [Blautia sp.]
MKEKLYLECSSGISGDMFVAALLDLGADQQKLLKVLASLPLDGYQVKISRVLKSGIDACDFDVILDREHENHDHDMEYLHGVGPASHGTHEQDDAEHHEHSHEHHHAHDHAHPHGHSHEHPHEHPHEHRGLAEITAIIDAGEMTDGARALAHRIFRIIAEAEGKAHHLPTEEVHFHEVGAVDSIVDIVSAAVCLDDLGFTEVIIPELSEGTGTVRCQHGVLPVPVPAVTNVIEAYGIPLRITSVRGELVTPTGAAIAAAIRTGSRLPETFSILKTGIGAGKRQYECPGILRAMCIQDRVEEETRVTRLETNIDDCTGEELGYVMELLFAAGARDVFYTPIYMKKNRPACLLSVICMEKDREKLEKIIFRETTTIGIRRNSMERTVLERRILRVETPWGMARVKACTLDGMEKYYPEFDSVKELADAGGLPLRDVYQLVHRTALLKYGTVCGK